MKYTVVYILCDLIHLCSLSFPNVASTLQLNENLSFKSLATSNNDIQPLATKSEEGADGERISVAAIIAFSVGGFVLVMVAITAIYCCFFVSETTTGTDGVVHSNTPHHAVVNTESDSHEHDPTTTIDQQQEFGEEERESLDNGIQLVNKKTNYV